MWTKKNRFSSLAHFSLDLCFNPINMCNNIDDDLSIEELEGRYGRRPKRQMKLDFGDFKFTRRKKGVDLPKVMIITSAEPDLIQPYNWGKFKPWPGKPFSPVSFLNARIETIAQLPTWKPIQNNRCLIPVQGFMNISTWIKMESRIHWVKKTKLFYINSPDQSIISLGGLWNHWGR